MQYVIIRDNDTLAHSGVKGMRWGHRKTQNSVGTTLRNHNKKETDLRKRLTQLEKSEQVSSSDMKRIKYRNKSTGARIASNAAGQIIGVVVQDAVKSYLTTGSAVPKYSQMSSKEIQTRLKHIGYLTARDTILRDALAKSTANKYSADGDTKIKKEHMPKIFKLKTDQDWMEYGVGKVAPRVGKLAADYAGTSLSKAVATRRRNEEIFKQWGGNILAEKVADVTWSSDNLSQVIYKGMPPGVKPKKV